MITIVNPKPKIQIQFTSNPVIASNYNDTIEESWEESHGMQNISFQSYMSGKYSKERKSKKDAKSQQIVSSPSIMRIPVSAPFNELEQMKSYGKSKKSKDKLELILPPYYNSLENQEKSRSSPAYNNNNNNKNKKVSSKKEKDSKKGCKEKPKTKESSSPSSSASLSRSPMISLAPTTSNEIISKNPSISQNPSHRYHPSSFPTSSLSPSTYEPTYSFNTSVSPSSGTSSTTLKPSVRLNSTAIPSSLPLNNTSSSSLEPSFQNTNINISLSAEPILGTISIQQDASFSITVGYNSHDSIDSVARYSDLIDSVTPKDIMLELTTSTTSKTQSKVSLANFTYSSSTFTRQCNNETILNNILPNDKSVISESTSTSSKTIVQITYKFLVETNSADFSFIEELASSILDELATSLMGCYITSYDRSLYAFNQSFLKESENNYILDIYFPPKGAFSLTGTCHGSSTEALFCYALKARTIISVMDDSYSYDAKQESLAILKEFLNRDKFEELDASSSSPSFSSNIISTKYLGPHPEQLDIVEEPPPSINGYTAVVGKQDIMLLPMTIAVFLSLSLNLYVFIKFNKKLHKRRSLLPNKKDSPPPA